jgi:hypothetical protein
LTITHQLATATGPKGPPGGWREAQSERTEVPDSMSIVYATVAMTGLNDPAKALKCADKHPHYWDTFADAKAALVARAGLVYEHLDASKCRYQMRSESGDHHYEVSIEYGPRSRDSALPFKTVFHVYECTARDRTQEVRR